MLKNGRIPLVVLDEAEPLSPDLARRQHKSACVSTGGGEMMGWLLHRRITVEVLAPFSHGRSCVCCSRQGSIVAALNQLFLDRVRGVCPPFTSVVLFCAARSVTDMQVLLRRDVVLCARYEI